MRFSFTIIAAKGDSWGLGVQYYHCDCALTFQFLCWYLLIEKDNK